MGYIKCKEDEVTWTFSQCKYAVRLAANALQFSVFRFPCAAHGCATVVGTGCVQGKPPPSVFFLEFKWAQAMREVCQAA